MNPAVYTKRVLPHPLLQPHVRFFAFRKFDSGRRIFPKAIITEHEVIITFFLHCNLFGLETIEGINDLHLCNKNNPVGCHFTGLQTFTKGLILFKGATTILSIHFMPTGFYHLFNVSPKEILDKFGDTEILFSNEIRLLVEELHNQNNIETTVHVLEKYLLQRLSQQKPRYRHPGIRSISETLVQSNGIYPIKKLANDYNLTIQTLETQFTEQVGIDPKSFCCMLRFNKAVNIKLYTPQVTWTRIAHRCGYYDQMHLIKEFKKFTALSPKNFMSLVRPPIENFIKTFIILFYSFTNFLQDASFDNL
ncbi:MAG: AraC family transcriptional regulator [Williamsia sp.]|nr:AraC family transcriptional regulator [Williamsia sp.]